MSSAATVKTNYVRFFTSGLFVFKIQKNQQQPKKTAHAEPSRPLSETRGSAGETLLIYVMPQRQ